MKPLRAFILVGLAALSGARCNCASGPGEPEPPYVTVSVVDPNPVTNKVAIRVNVTGCEQVASLSLYDREAFLKTILYVGNPTTLALLPSEILYRGEMAANLSLTARVTCNDGRTSTSPPQSTQFLPVETLYEVPNGQHLVADYFFAQGSGTDVFFVGCATLSNGAPGLAKSTTQGVVATVMVNDCPATAWFTARNSVTGVRWMMTNHASGGVYAFDDALNIVRPRLDGPTSRHFGVGTSGDGYTEQNAGGTLRILIRAAPAAGAANIITAEGGINTQLSAAPVETAQGLYWPVVSQSPAGGGDVSYGVDIYAPGGSGTPSKLTHLTLGGTGFLPQRMPSSYVSPDAQTHFIPVLTPNTTVLYACVTHAESCTGATRRWLAELPGGIALLRQHGSVLIVGTATTIYFLDVDSGQPLSVPIHVSAGLTLHSIDVGKGPDVYIVGAGGGVPVEIIAVDSPSSGEVFRFRSITATSWITVDDGGQPWIRVANRLARPLPLPAYRELRAR